MYLFMILAVVTIIYLVLSAWMDLKERKIYSFPGIMLSLSWLSYLFSTGEHRWQFLVCYTIFHVALWFLFNRLKMWGAGDSDVFLLLSNVLLALTGPISGWRILFLECTALIGILDIAIIVGFIESKIKKSEFSLKTKAAVVPGFAVVISVLLVIGIIGRIW